MFQDYASCRAAHLRFVERVVASQKVWYLENRGGTASACSNQDTEEGEDSEITILMFWSDRAYATRVKNNGFGD
ncbi:MAG: hypothetical protein JWM59_947 [Verrucomicrobiales bacterium]|nr:hypothetical protein [Verrucomicrobiales bacterium]